MPWNAAGLWTPELNLDGWNARSAPGHRPWNERERSIAGAFDDLNERELRWSLGDLAADYSAVRRDALLYANGIEELKRRALSGTSLNPDLDDEAGWLVSRLQHLHVASADLAATDGGPPPITGSRWFGGVMNWLAGKLGQVSQWLLRAAVALTELLRKLIGSAPPLEIGIVLGIPPALEFGIGAQFEQLGLRVILQPFLEQTYATPWF